MESSGGKKSVSLIDFVFVIVFVFVFVVFFFFVFVLVLEAVLRGELWSHQGARSQLL